jgi:hypothetical protein
MLGLKMGKGPGAAGDEDMPQAGGTTGASTADSQPAAAAAASASATTSSSGQQQEQHSQANGHDKVRVRAGARGAADAVSVHWLRTQRTYKCAAAVPTLCPQAAASAAAAAAAPPPDVEMSEEDAELAAKKEVSQ